MADMFGVIERSLTGYPGCISAIIDLHTQKDLGVIKQQLLEDNPMLTALFLHGISWKDHKEIAEWGKKNDLKVGISADHLGSEDIKKVIDSGYIDFLRLTVGKNSDIKNKIGFIRSSGIKHEFVYKMEGSNVKHIENVYKTISPCDSFVIEMNKNLDDKTRDYLVKLASKYKSLFLRNTF